MVGTEYSERKQRSSIRMAQKYASGEPPVVVWLLLRSTGPSPVPSNASATAAAMSDGWVSIVCWTVRSIVARASSASLGSSAAGGGGASVSSWGWEQPASRNESADTVATAPGTLLSIYSTVTDVGERSPSTQGKTHAESAATMMPAAMSSTINFNHQARGSIRQIKPYISLPPIRNVSGDLGRRSRRERLPMVQHPVCNDPLGGGI